MHRKSHVKLDENNHINRKKYTSEQILTYDNFNEFQLQQPHGID